MTASPRVESLSAADAEWIIDCRGLSNTQRAALAAICDGQHKVCRVQTEAQAREEYERSEYFGQGGWGGWLASRRALGLIREEPTNG